MARPSVVTTVEFKYVLALSLSLIFITSVVTTVEFKLKMRLCANTRSLSSVVTTVEFKFIHMPRIFHQ